MKIFSDKYTVDQLLCEKADFCHFTTQDSSSHFWLQHVLYRGGEEIFSAYFQWRNNTLVKEIMSFGQSSIRMISALSMRTSSTAKILHYFKQVCQGRNALLVIPKPLWTSVSNRKTPNKQHLPFIHFILLVYPWGSRLLCVRVMDFQIHFILTQKDFLLYCYSIPKQIFNSEKWMCYRNSQKCLNILPHLPSMLSCRKLFFGFP